MNHRCAIKSELSTKGTHQHLACFHAGNPPGVLATQGQVGTETAGFKILGQTSTKVNEMELAIKTT